MRTRVVLTAWVGCSLAYSSLANSQAPRPLEVSDVIALQAIQRVAASPNGDLMVIVVKRPGGPVTSGSEALNDVWLASRDSRALRNLTEREPGVSHWRKPTWSPDGKRVALIGSAGDHEAGLYIWSLANGTLKRVVDADVDEHASTDSSTLSAIPMRWLDSATLLCPMLPRGMPPGFEWGSVTQAERAAEQGWAKTEIGEEPSVSVIESEHGPGGKNRPQGQLLRIDVRTGQSRVLAEGNFWKILISPTNHYAALIADGGRLTPDPHRRLPAGIDAFDTRRSRLALLSLDSAATTRWVDDVRDPAALRYYTSNSWSPDGETFAVIGKGDSTDAAAATAFLVTANTGRVRRASPSNIRVINTAWADNDSVLILARLNDRTDWWAIDARSDTLGKPGRRLTADLSDVPNELITTATPSTVYGLSNGHLVTIDVRDGSRLANPLPDSLSVRLLIRGDADGLVVQTTSGAFYRIRAARADRMAQPSPAATAVVMDLKHHLTAFTDAGRTGTFLWSGDGQTPHFDRQLALNERLRTIADAKRRLISYVGVDGDSLHALLVLPVNYIPGRRYPLITSVYGGDIVSDTAGYFEKQDVTSMNLALLPAHGYALLIPSIPLSPDGVPADPMMDIPKSVMPAVDEVVRMGIADPLQLGVMGISYGGYSTYSLLTNTHRFRAAIAFAGPADLASDYGTLETTRRYTNFGYEMSLAPAWAESGQGAMGASPWGNLWRYMRNSPYYFADRIDTPIMIIQGDDDSVAIEQGEEMFTALYRLGRQVTMVRYWGEEHVIQRSPANVRDMWRRVFRWFDDRLGVARRSADLR